MMMMMMRLVVSRQNVARVFCRRRGGGKHSRGEAIVRIAGIGSNGRRIAALVWDWLD